MKSLIIQEDKYTPYISFEVETNQFEIAGESYSEYTLHFFEPVLEWLNQYLAQNNRPITFNFRMTYYNTSTSRRFFEILKILEDFYQHNSIAMSVNWFANSNDMDMIEAGEDYQEDFSNLPFNILIQETK